MCRIAAFQAAQGDDRAFFNEIQSLKSLSGFSVVRETSDCALGSTANRISGSNPPFSTYAVPANRRGFSWSTLVISVG